MSLGCTYYRTQPTVKTHLPRVGSESTRKGTRRPFLASTEQARGSTRSCITRSEKGPPKNERWHVCRNRMSTVPTSLTNQRTRPAYYTCTPQFLSCFVLWTCSSACLAIGDLSLSLCVVGIFWVCRSSINMYLCFTADEISNMLYSYPWRRQLRSLLTLAAFESTMARTTAQDHTHVDAPFVMQRPCPNLHRESGGWCTPGLGLSTGRTCETLLQRCVDSKA